MISQELPADIPILPQRLPILRCRLTLRLLQDTTLPAAKGALLRGGFGYAFQRAICAPTCWGNTSRCTMNTICAYRRVFESSRPPGVEFLRDLQDVPRPFVVDLPPDQRTFYAAGESVEFGLGLIGQGVADLPYFLYGFARLGELGLGRARAQALLDRVETLDHWAVIGTTIYRDGRAIEADGQLPLYDTATIAARAAELPSDLRLTLIAPTRIKSGGSFLNQIEPAALVRSICWRLHALSVFHSTAPWLIDIGPLLAAAANVTVTHQQIRWVDLERRSDHRGIPERIAIGGMVGSATLHNVGPTLRAILLAGSLIHVGKACVFGNGAFRIDPA